MMRTIGRYEIVKELGRGAMGVVYLANDPRLHRQVAVKTYSLPDGVSEELAKEFHARFLREAQAAAGLSHPGIVTVYDAGEDAALGVPYIAMEFIPGQSLKQRLEKRDRLDSAWVMTFGAVLAEALHVAHQAGIIHRDIKPANILIREGDGAAKIADFGVARLKSSDLTQSGAALGSPGYMSPEQVRGGVLDGRSDLFSLAVVLYEALCGKRPFHGDDLVSLAYSIAHDTQVPLSRQLQSCPAGLDRFFDRALSKDPDKRYPDGTAFRAAFLTAASHAAADLADRTAVDAVTVGVPDAATRAVRPGAAAPGAGAVRKRPGRGPAVALTFAALALVAAGLATAAFMRYGRPSAHASHLQAPGPPRPEPAPESTAQRETGHRTGDPQSHEASPNPPEGPHSTSVARSEVEPVAAVPRMPRNIQLTVPLGTELHVTIDAPVGSSSSHPGDTFTARVTDPVLAGDRVAIPAGSRVHGHVVESNPAKKGLSDKGGSLTLAFDRVVTPFGFEAAMSAAMTTTATGSAQKNAKIIGGSAAGGALLGKILGGKSKNAAVGSLLGAAVGTGVAAGTKGQDVDIPAGSTLTCKLDQPLSISSQP